MKWEDGFIEKARSHGVDNFGEECEVGIPCQESGEIGPSSNVSDYSYFVL